MNRDGTMKKSGTFPRLIKMLFRFNPTLLPIIIALILITFIPAITMCIPWLLGT